MFDMAYDNEEEPSYTGPISLVVVAFIMVPTAMVSYFLRQRAMQTALRERISHNRETEIEFVDKQYDEAAYFNNAKDNDNDCNYFIHESNSSSEEVIHNPMQDR